MPVNVNVVDVCQGYQDSLRILRRVGTKPEKERVLLGQMEDLYNAMTDVEQAQVEAIGWRSWPDEFDKRC